MKTTPSPQHRRTTGIRRGLFAALAAMMLAVPTSAFADTVEDPNLDQTLDPDMAVVNGERVLDSGHVDMGPTFVDGEWSFLVHDDAGKADANARSVWRYPDETVMHVLDESQLTVPDDPAYGFVGAEAGSTVWVVPQTQHPDVVWLGWNTQDPEVMQTIDRGITLSLTGVQGPGIMTTYLQSGSFGEPQVLFDSRVPDAQSVWVDVNTHTHANWVFTEPGVYLVRLQADADLIDGTTVSDTQLVRFAVGTATPTADALIAVWDGAADPVPSDEPAESAAEQSTGVGAAATDQAGDPLVTILIGAIVLVAVGLIAGVAVVIVRGNRAKKRILTARQTAPAPDSVRQNAGDGVTS